MGDVRGKNDIVDAQRIARYAYKNRDEIKLYVPPRAIIDQLDNLPLRRSDWHSWQISQSAPNLFDSFEWAEVLWG